MKKILWLSLVCMCCVSLTAPADEDFSEEEPAAEETPKKKAKQPAKKAAPAKKPQQPAADNTVSWRFLGPFRTGYQDNLRKSAVYCTNLAAVQTELKKQKFNWDYKKIKGVTFTRKGNNAVLIVTGEESTIRQMQHALSKAFSNEVRTLTWVPKSALTPAHFAAAKPPPPPPKEGEKGAAGNDAEESEPQE